MEHLICLYMAFSALLAHANGLGRRCGKCTILSFFFHRHVWNPKKYRLFQPSCLRWTWVQWPQSMRRHAVTARLIRNILSQRFESSPFYGAEHVISSRFTMVFVSVSCGGWDDFPTKTGITRRSQWACRMPCKASPVARTPWAFWHSLWLCGMKDAVLAYFTANG